MVVTEAFEHLVHRLETATNGMQRAIKRFSVEEGLSRFRRFSLATFSLSLRCLGAEATLVFLSDFSFPKLDQSDLVL